MALNLINPVEGEVASLNGKNYVFNALKRVWNIVPSSSVINDDITTTSNTWSASKIGTTVENVYVEQPVINITSTMNEQSIANGRILNYDDMLTYSVSVTEGMVVHSNDTFIFYSPSVTENKTIVLTVVAHSANGSSLSTSLITVVKVSIGTENEVISIVDFSQNNFNDGWTI